MCWFCYQLIWLRPYKVRRESKWATSVVVVSLVDWFLDLALNSTMIRTKCRLRLDISTKNFSKLSINKSNSSTVWLCDLHNDITYSLLIHTCKIMHSFKQVLKKHLTGKASLIYAHTPPLLMSSGWSSLTSFSLW